MTAESTDTAAPRERVRALMPRAEEPGCLVHVPDESVDPTEIERMAPAEALFLRSYAGAFARSAGT
ncbi:hypothetical protein ABZ618_16545 [Streptomyces roseolus]|uniref:hypothetical protein n=1 Tax=Streptomyces roseolus TaxID=67358 RepID=UPI0033F240D6